MNTDRVVSHEHLQGVTVKAGTRNGMRNGTRNGSKMWARAIITCTVRAGRLYSLDWTGLTQKSVFSVGQKLSSSLKLVA